MPAEILWFQCRRTDDTCTGHAKGMPNRNVDCLPLLRLRIREPRVAYSSFEGEALVVLSKTDLIASTPNTRTDVGILMKEF